MLNNVKHLSRSSNSIDWFTYAGEMLHFVQHDGLIAQLGKDVVRTAITFALP